MAVKTTIRTPMPIHMRAKQFAMFDALKGLTEAIVEKERQYVPKKELTEEKISEINQKLMMLRRGDPITVEYSCEYGHELCVLSGNVEKVDSYWKSLQVGNITISFSEIMDIHNRVNNAKQEQKIRD